MGCPVEANSLKCLSDIRLINLRKEEFVVLKCRGDLLPKYANNPLDRCLCNKRGQNLAFC